LAFFEINWGWNTNKLSFKVNYKRDVDEKWNLGFSTKPTWLDLRWLHGQTRHYLENRKLFNIPWRPILDWGSSPKIQLLHLDTLPYRET
jgi:hypothetical protein